MMNTALPQLTDGGLGNRVRCYECRRMVQMYLAAEDGSVLRDESGMPVLTLRTLPACPFCGLEGREGWGWGESAQIKGKIGSSDCDAACREATGTTCKCSCGGSSHGIL